MLRLRIPSYKLLLALGTLLVACIYLPGLRGPFIFDDYPNLLENALFQTKALTLSSALQAALSSDASILRRPLSMLSFWINYVTSGFNPLSFKATNLAIHIFTMLAVYHFLRLLLLIRHPAPPLRNGSVTTHSTTVAAIAALVWAAHPINLTAVLYVVQRMTSLSALFTVLGLAAFVHYRLQLRDYGSGLRRLVFSTAVLTALATLSKENGILLLPLCFLTETAFFRFQTKTRKHKNYLYLFWILTIALPALAVALFLTINFNWLTNGYHTRPFTLYERAITEPRIIWHYILWITLPTPRTFGLFHDDIAISSGLFHPISTFTSIVALAICTGLSIYYTLRGNLIAYGFLFFLTGHLLESTILPLELTFEHRNYLPSIGLIFSLIASADYLLKRANTKTMPTYLAIGLIAVTSMQTAIRANAWKDPTSIALYNVRNHPKSSRAQYNAGYTLGEAIFRTPGLAPLYANSVEQHLRRSAELNKSRKIGLFQLILFNSTQHRPIPDHLYDELRNRLRNTHLHITVTRPFLSLVTWAEEGLIKPDEVPIQSLFLAALSNPTLSSEVQAVLFSQLSRYELNVDNNQQEAVRLALAASAAAPRDPIYHLSAARLATTLGNYAEAQRQLVDTERYDEEHRLQLQIETLKKELSENRPPEATNPNAPPISKTH